MKSFTDRQGRSWTIEINYTSLRRVHAVTGINLTRIVDPRSNVMEQLTGDPFVLFDCLVAILQPQLDERRSRLSNSAKHSMKNRGTRPRWR